MRSRWLLSVAVCALSAGITAALPKPPLSSTGEPRTPVPADPKAPVNKIAERPGVRGFADADEPRAVIPPAARTIAPPDRASRGDTAARRDASRSGTDPALSHDRALLRVLPGEKANLIPDAAANRDFSAPSTGRQELPARPLVPTDRSGTQAPRNR